MESELQLRAGIAVSVVIEGLKRLTTGAQNIVSGGGGRDPKQQAFTYLTWVEEVERALRHWFAVPLVWQELHTPRYEQIRSIDNRTARPGPLISMEAEAQAERLGDIVERLRHEQQAFELSTGQVAVMPDTNVFIHFQRYDQIDWLSEVGTDAVRLVVPLLVLDQLDEKSYRSIPLGDRVRGVIGSLRKLRDNDPPEKPVHVRDGVELQVLMDPVGHKRRTNSDDEFLARAEHIASIAGADRVLIATGDHGMQLRAASRRLRCLSMPERLRISLKGV